jgi:hypothetical protein
VSSLRRFAAGGEEGALVSLEQVNPGFNVAGVANVTINAELGTEEGGAKLSN